MDRRILFAAALLAPLMPLGTAQADVEVSAFALPLFEPEATVTGVVGMDVLPFAVRYEPRPSTSPKPSAQPQAEETVIKAAAPRYHSTRYRPRRSRPPQTAYPGRSDVWRGATQVHAGFMRQDATSQAGGLLGFRVGPRFGENMSMGFGADLRWSTETISEVAGSGQSVGGQQVLIRREIAQSTSSHVPMMGYLEFSPGNALPVSPYVGGGVGYQWLFLYGEDYTTGERYEATFGNWGWQAWAGLTMRLSDSVRLNGEAFYNDAMLHRDTRAPDGTLIRESVDMEGVGGRFGLSFGLF